MNAPSPTPRRRAPRLPPVAVFLVVALLMWGACAWTPSWRSPLPARSEIVGLLLLVAGAIGIAGLRAFRHARTTVDPLRPGRATSLVTVGIYRHTRNPMYVALAVALFAWAAWLSHPLALLGIVGFVAWMNHFQIASEERALRELFGGEYARYCHEVRRWI